MKEITGKFQGNGNIKKYSTIENLKYQKKENINIDLLNL